MTWFLPDVFYFCAAVFLLGVAWRCLLWLRSPLPLKIPLTPGPATASGVAARVAGEVVCFRSLYRADRKLWLGAWTFHLSLVLLAIGHFGGLVAPRFASGLLGMTDEQFHHLAQVSGGAIGILAALPLIYLIFRRFTLERVRHISSFSDYFAPALLLLVIATGNQMRFMGQLDIVQARQFVSGLLRFQPVPPPADFAFAAHLVLVSILIAYIPLSKLMHLGGIFFSPTLTQTNNPRDCRHVNPWDSHSALGGSQAAPSHGRSTT